MDIRESTSTRNSWWWTHEYSVVDIFQVGANLFGDYSTLAEAVDDDLIVWIEVQ
jgi:hypothetical protein